MRFMHIADVHLGYQQYGLKERFNDFSRTFLQLIEEALAKRVDFVLLAGDLFEKRTVDPLAMRVAIQGFTELHAAGIPVLAIEGNHEKAYYHEQYSWMDFLDGLGYIRLLNPTFEEGQAILTPHGDEGGAYVDLPLNAAGDALLRVYGLKYYGASIGKAMEMFAEALAAMDHSQVQYAILMLHAGLEGPMAHTGRLRYDDVALVRGMIDYVALGHIHKPYELEDWLYNPGSPETNSMEEVKWPERGYYLVDIRPGGDPPHAAELISTQRRPFYRFPVKVDTLETPNAVYDAVQKLTVVRARDVKRAPAPVVELRLGGVLPFNRYDLDVNHIQTLVDDAWKPLVTRVKNDTTPLAFEVRVEEETSRPELERAIVRDLLARDARYRPEAKAWADGALFLKRMVLEGDTPEAVIAHLRQLRAELGTAGGEG